LCILNFALAAFPEKPITFIVHSKPGSAIDITTRQLIKIARQYSPVTFLVENKTGASGVVAMRTVLDKAADGYTMLAVTKSFISTVLLTHSGINMARFYFTACLVIDPEVLITNRRSDVRTLPQIIADARRQKGKQKWLGPLVGGVDHLMAVKTWHILGIHAEWIPFEGGSDALAALLGRHGAVYVGNPVDVLGRPDLMIAAVSAKKRLANFPDSPTFSEFGYHLTNDVLWRGYAVKKGTPAAAKTYLENLFRKISADPEWLKFINNTAAQPVFLGHRAFEQMVQRNRIEAEKYLRLAGILKNTNKTVSATQSRLFALGTGGIFLLLLLVLFIFKRNWLQPETIIALFLIFMSFYLYLLTLDFPQGKLGHTAGPAAMPRLWLWGLVFFSLWLIFDRLGKVKTKEKKSPNAHRAFLLAGCTALYLLAINPLGYYLSTFLFLTAGAYLLSYRKHLIILGSSMGFTVLSYFIFYKILGVPLPPGLFF